jgi:hypothetical protein
MIDLITRSDDGILLSPYEFAEANNLDEFDIRPYIELLARDHQSLTEVVQHVVTVLNTVTASLNAIADDLPQAREASEPDTRTISGGVK